MNTKLTHVLMALISTLGFSDEISFQNQPKINTDLQSEFLDTTLTKTPKRKGSIYFRAMTDSQPIDRLQVFPGYGIGYRKSFDHYGVDVSANFSIGDGANGKQKQIVWTAPKVSYLHYFNPKADSSLYGGVGLAWGGTYFSTWDDDEYNDEVHSKFIGLVPSATVGFELMRSSQVFSFTELTVSQPLIPSSREGSAPTPIAELSIGAGF